MESVTDLKRRRALRERSQSQTKVRGSLPAVSGQTVNLPRQVDPNLCALWQREYQNALTT